jgi:hypothetical protein
MEGRKTQVNWYLKPVSPGLCNTDCRVPGYRFGYRFGYHLTCEDANWYPYWYPVFAQVESNTDTS